MSVITSIEPQIKDKTRCSIFIDGRFYCGIKLEVAIKYRLKAGMEIDRAELDKIQLETEKVQATEKQMRDFLAKKEYVDAVVDYVMDKMHYYGYVNDAEYCKAYVGGISGKSKRAIELELLKRGVNKETVREALSDYEDDEEQILKLLQKYLKGKELTKENVYKACRYLVSKGYEYDAVKSVSESLNGDGDY